MRKLDIKKSNPTKYRFSNLIASVTFAHVFILVFRSELPGGYLFFNDLVPFNLLILLALSGLVIYFWTLISKIWELLQASLLLMGLFYLIVALSLIFSGGYNGAIMWSGAVFVCAFTFNMKPIELVRGQDGQ